MAWPRDETKVDALLDAALSEVAGTGSAALSIDAVARRREVAPELVTIDRSEHHDLYMPGRGFEASMAAAMRWFSTHLAST